MRTNFMIIALLAASAFVLTACPAPENTNTAASPAASPEAAAESSKETMNETSATETDIVDGAIASKDHTTLVAAVKAAELVETLKGEGPFTVFAPTNAAFSKLPDGTVDSLLKPENKDQLEGILTYHVVTGNLDSAAVAKAIEEGNGKALLKTVQGGDLTASKEGDSVIITDAKGGKAKVTAVDLKQKNGVIHVIDTVLMPSN
ncbi:MAG: fasciclin domain-containing protein [Acidobacteriota bacterium]|nr:MAG: fasciclin domain-containing protein [Acidobacteriota bacterium]